MKKLLCLGSFAAIILAAQSCDRNMTDPQDTMVTRVIHAVNSQTRTCLDGLDVVWEKDDTVCCIAVYDDERLDNARYSLYCNLHPSQINGSSADIEVTCGSAFTPEYIIYPSSDKVKMPVKDILEIPVPESYTMVKGNIPVASNIAVGKIEDDNVFMKNAMTLMKFEVDYPDEMDPDVDGIKRIVILSNAGESIAGTMAYAPELDKVVSVEGASKLFLNLPEDETYFPEGTYWFPLPSVTLSQGFKVKISRMDDFVATKTYDSELQLERNTVVNMGKTSDWGLVYENTVRVLAAEFSDGVTAINNTVWAFVDESGSNAFPSYKVACTAREIGPYYIPGNTDAPFYFFVTKDANSSHDSWRQTKGAGFRFGGTVHDYMLLPAIKDFKLVSVSILSGKDVKYAITDNPTTGVPTSVSGGEEKLIGTKKSHIFTLSDTKANTAYRLDMPTATFAALYKFELTYEQE